MIKDKKTPYSFRRARQLAGSIVAADQARVAYEIKLAKLKKAEELRQQQDTLKDQSENVQDSIQKSNTTGRPSVSIKSNQPQSTSVYTTMSPEEYEALTSDTYAFQDAIMPQLLDPNLDAWTQRQVEKNSSPIKQRHPAVKSAVMAANAQQQHKEDLFKAAKDHKLLSDRLNRRIYENKTFGLINKNKALTDDEVSEIFTYRALTDPEYLKLSLDYLEKVTNTQKAAEEADLAELLSHKPKDYIGQQAATNSVIQYGVQGTGGFSAVGLSAAGLGGSRYADSAFADFIIKTNQSQAQVQSGQITRANELKDLAAGAKEYVDLTRQYASNLNQIYDIQRLTNYGQIVNKELNDRLNQLLSSNREIRNIINSKKLYDKINNLSSWSSSGIFGQAAQYVDALIDDDLGGIRKELFGIDTNLDDIVKHMQTNKFDKKWLDDLNQKLNTTDKILKQFNDNTDQKIQHWREGIDQDYKDIQDWISGKNWMHKKAVVDDYYKAQAQILQNEQYSWRDPVKLAAFGWSGIAGGSNSSWWKSGISLASSVFGYTYGFGMLKKAKTIAQLGAMAVGFEANKSAGSDENNIEASNMASDKLRNILMAHGKYDDFIKEGIQQLLANSESRGVAILGDDDVVKQYVMDMFLAGAWKSKDFDITTAHRDAIVGSNNLFYNDQPVNTADAAVSAVVSTLHISPIQQLNMASKIKAAGRLGRMKFAKTAVGLKYAGFKAGVHGAYKKAVESAAVQDLKKGVITIASKTYSKTGAKKVVNTAKAIVHKTADVTRYIGREAGIARAYNNMRRYASSVPTVWMKAAATAKKAGNIAARTAIDTASEMLQEGVQGFNAQYAKDDSYGYDQQYNTGMSQRIFNDILTGGKAALYWINQNDPAYQTDADVVPSMNATPLLTLFGPNTISIVSQAHSLHNDFKAIDIIRNNLDIMKRSSDAELRQGEALAKLARMEDRRTTLNRFKSLNSWIGSHQRYTDKENAYRRVRGEDLLKEGENAIPTELIEDQWHKYEDISSLVHSEQAQVLAKRAGINLDSIFHKGKNNKKFDKLISLLNYRLNSRNESYEALRETDQQIQEMFGFHTDPDENYYEDDVDVSNTPKSISDNTKALVSLYSMYQLFEDYSKLEKQTAKEHSVSNHFKTQINALQEVLKKKGIDVNSKESVLQLLENSQYGSALYEMLSPALQKQGIDISTMSAREILDGKQIDDYNDAYLNPDNYDDFGGIASVYRQRQMQEYDALLQQQLLDDFAMNPNSQLSKVEGRFRSDKALRDIIEEDYVNSIRRYEDAASREVKDGDIFVGNDGHWYITHGERQKDGSIKWTKRRYHPNNGKIDNEDLPFSRVEYNDSLTERETKYKEQEQNKQQQQSKNTQQDQNKPESVNSDEQSDSEVENDTESAEDILNSEKTIPIEPAGETASTETTPTETRTEEQRTEETPTEEPKTEQTPVEDPTGKYVIVHTDRGDRVGVIDSFDPKENTVTVMYKDGGMGMFIPLTDLQFIDKPEDKALPKYRVGDKVRVNNAIGTIVSIDTFADGSPCYHIAYDDGNGTDTNIFEESDLSDYNEEENLKPLVETNEGRVKPNQKQQDTLDKLKQKQENDKTLVATDKNTGNKITTAFNYFIKVGNRFMSFIRVHGIIGSQMNKTVKQLAKYNEVLSLLKNATNIKQEIIIIQNQYNDELAKTYGNDSFEYNRYKIDLSMYTKQQMLTESEIDNTIQAIAEITSNEIPGPAVIAGQIVDEIGRAFFAGEKLENKPEYKMTDAIFRDTIEQFKKLQAIFTTRGWVLDTTPYTWYFTTNNGKRVAGETDLIAIDQDGNIHVLDFKTTKNINRFKKIRQFKTTNPLTGKEEWQILPEGAPAPEGVKSEDIVETYPFFTETPRDGYNRNYAQQYARQLHMYRLMIQDQTGVKVTSLEIVPFHVDYDNQGSDVSYMSTVEAQDVIELNGVAVEDEFKNLDNYLQSKTDNKEKIDDIHNKIEIINQFIDSLKEALNAKYTSQDTKYEIQQLLKNIEDLQEYKKAIDENEIDKIDSITDNVTNKILEINDKIREEKEEFDKTVDHTEEIQHKPLPESWDRESVEPVPESGKKHWYQFNNLHSTFEFLKTIPNYLKSIIKPDFITNSEFKITRNDDGTFSVDITYNPKGLNAIHFGKSLNIRLGNEIGSNNDVQSDPGDLSVMARNLIRQYIQLFESLKKGEYIIAKNVQRTNGKLVYSETDRPLYGTQFISADLSTNKLIDGENSLIGVVGTNGEIFEVEDAQRSSIGSTYKFDEQGKPLPKGYTPVPGNEQTQDEHMPPGSVVYLYKFKYDEDPVDAPMRVVYITLRGKKFSLNDANLIVDCLKQMARDGSKETDVVYPGVRIYEDDGKGGEREVGNADEELRNEITCRQILKILTRFGKQASSAGHEFIFEYADKAKKKDKNPNKIRITDMEAEPVLDPKTNTQSRPTIVLDISEPGDVEKLIRILMKTDMHINQVGIMKAKFQDENSIFGMMCRNLFENGDRSVTRIKFGNFEITRDDYKNNFDGITWMVKNGSVTTNVADIQNPLISIIELDKTSKEAERKKTEEEKKPVSDGGKVGVEQETKEQSTEPAKPAETKQEQQKKKQKVKKPVKPVENKSNFDDSELDAAADLGDLFGNDDIPSGLTLSTNRLANERLSKEQRTYVEKETKRLVGNVPLIFVEHEVASLAGGAKVAGMISTDAITLSMRAPEGAQYHEAFHRILELLVGEKRRQKIYQRYEHHFGEAFEKANGRKLTERDIAEGLAEMFRAFMNDRDHINITWKNFWKIGKIFNEVKQYIQAIRNIGDRNFAKLFILANSGYFRYIKPKQPNIERFVNDFNGQMYLVINGNRYTTDENGKRITNKASIELSEFPQFGGMQMFEEAVDHIISTIINGYSIDMTASNAAKIVTDLKSMQKLFHRGEKTEHSAFFRVLTGEYVNDEGGMTIQDAMQYYKTYYGTREINELTAQAIKDVGVKDIKNITSEELNEVRKQTLRLIAKQESNKSFDELHQQQKMFAQLFDKNNWDIVEQKINRRMRVLGIDSQLDRLQKQEDDENDVPGDEDGSYIGQEIAAHDDAFYTHDRSEDTTAAVRFMLSTIPDERFATEDDVKAGRVKSTVNKDGTRVMIPNNKGILGFTGYVPRDIVKNMLLSLCHKCTSAEDLLAKMHELAQTEPIFYRLERKYAALLNNSIKKHDDGKYVIIKKNGEQFDKNSYLQHNGEYGVYFTYADKNGKDTQQRIDENDYDVDTTSSEALATQIFNFVSSQKLDFMQVSFEPVLDEDGQPIENKYTAKLRSSDSGYAAKVFPTSWFVAFRSGVSGVFFMNKNGNIKFVKNGTNETGRALLETARNTLGSIYRLYKGINNNKSVNGRSVNTKSASDFIYIEQQFINSLNTLGIDISREALDNYLRIYFNTEEKGISLQDAFGYLITTVSQDLSFQKFIDTVIFNKKGNTLCDILLGKNQDAINEILTSNKKENLEGKHKEYASGSKIYEDNAFVKWCAQAVSTYNKSTKELMTNGPENTKQYTMAQRHTAYDMTEDINNGKYDEKSDTFSNSSILRDSSKWDYCWSFRSLFNGQPQRIGSLIMKYVANGGKSKLELKTYNGAKVASDINGGVKYTKTSEREDYIGKCQMLALGKIIFPTLSDKSTWFYVDGIKTPGLDYSNIKNTQTRNLLHLVETSDGVHIKFTPSNDQLKQMIEYAFCERNAIAKEIEREANEDKKSPFSILNRIERISENRMRFGSLTKIVRMGADGKLETLHLTGSEHPAHYLEEADKWFFGKDITDAQRIEMMTLTLEEGFYENLALAEHCGAIVVNKKLSKLNRLFTYKNVAFDSIAIDKLEKKYIEELTPSGENISEENAAKAKSQAVLAYMWDVYVRGLISEEEVERLYTGSPISYKWKYGIIDGVKRLIDRHSDQTKRLGGLGSTGERNRPYMVGIRKTYKCAEVEDQMVISKQLDALKQFFPDSEIRQAYLEYKSKSITDRKELEALNDKIYGTQDQDEMSLDEIKKDLEADGMNIIYEAAKKRGEDEAAVYGLDDKGKPQINVADGAAYITPKMAKNLLRQLGKYTKPVREAFEYLEGKKGKNIFNNKQAQKIIFEAMLGAQKYSAYGYRMVDNVKVQYYNKFALFPLFDQMASGYTKQILKKMESQHVDMLMMHSAVKIGSQNPALITKDILTNKDAFDAFEFDTYDQDYKFIRRQLNTDPHEKEFAQMGTQMTKVALTSLLQDKEYVTNDGKRVRGRDLLHSIMKEINNLSTFGMQELKHEMFDENDNLDIEKFSRFLEQELESRDADENLIDGIQVIYDKQHNAHFKVNLEAMSSIDWIQSILVAKLNKKIVDINVKGNAFYQRSIWGAEGKPTILSDESIDYTINGGEDLKMVNNDGSMDAVISLDFFRDILPENLKDDFEGARKWLIKNKVIGKDAIANTIASRIPTQAQSSIHALRFVDVLPVVRDTIMLPKEFTRTTGSDFDIDKLYLARLSYRPYKLKIEKDGKQMEIDKLSTKFEKDPENQSRNNLLNYYLTILKDHGKDLGNGTYKNGSAANISLRSIDADTLLVDNVLSLIEKNVKEQEEYSYKFGNIAFQSRTRGQFVVGKFGIGPFALNNNNQILTQLFGVKFDQLNCPILRELGCCDLSEVRDKQNNLKLSWLSGLINAHVDVAKDPKVQRLNINTFTYNTTNLLIRTGMGDRTFMFLAQPIMRELASVYEMAGGNYLEDISMSKSARQKSAIINYIYENFKGETNTKKLKNIKDILNSIQNNPTQEESIGSFAKALFGINKDGSYSTTFEYIDDDGSIIEKEGCILQDIFQNENVLHKINESVTFDNLEDKIARYRVNVKLLNDDNQLVDSIIDLTPKDVQLYVAYINQALSKYGQKLSDLVNSCKIDTKKQGKSYVEQQAFKSKYNSVFDNDDKLFEQSGLTNLQKYSYIGTKTSNALSLYEQIISQISLQGTSQYKTLHEKLMEKFNSSEQNKELSKKISKCMMKVIKKLFFDTECIPQYAAERNMSDTQYAESLFFGKFTVQDQLLLIKNKIRNDQKGAFSNYGGNGIITNPLLNALQADIYEERDGYANPKFVKLENTMLDASDNANAIERAWDDLYHDEEHYIEFEDQKITFKQFAENLFVYAFYTSGDTIGKTKFFKYVPNTVRVGSGYADYMRRTQDDFTCGVGDFDLDYMYDQICLDNWTDSDIVKEFRTKRYGKWQASFFTQLTSSKKATELVTNKAGKSKWVVRTKTKVVNLMVACVKKDPKTGQKIPSIRSRLNEDQVEVFPQYIKIRQKSLDKFDPDNYILYKLVDCKPLDKGNPSAGVYPIYAITIPGSATLHAGSYNYDYIKPLDTKEVMYNDVTQDAVDQFFTGKHLMSDKPFVEYTLVDTFADLINKSPISFMEEDLIRRLREEFEYNKLEITDAILKKLVRENIDEEHIIKTRSDEKDNNSDKKEEKKKTNSKVVNIHYGNGENVKLSNLAKRPFTTEIKGLGKLKFNSVEGAFQATKMLFTEEGTYIESKDENGNYILTEKGKELLKIFQEASDDTGKIARKEGKSLKGLNVDEWEDVSDKILEKYMSESFEQNDDAKKALLDTGSKTIAHENAKGIEQDGGRFSRILTKIRKRLNESKSEVKEETVDEFKNRVKDTEIKDSRLIDIQKKASKDNIKDVIDEIKQIYFDSIKKAPKDIYNEYKSKLEALEKSTDLQNDIQQVVQYVQAIIDKYSKSEEKPTTKSEKVDTSIDDDFNVDEGFEESKPIDLRHKDAEQFGNTYYRPFSKNGISYDNVIQANYCEAVMNSTQLSQEEKITYTNRLHESSEYNMMRQILNEIRDKYGKESLNITPEMMISNMKESFKQNPKILNKLLSTTMSKIVRNGKEDAVTQCLTIARTELQNQKDESKQNDKYDNSASKHCKK